MHICMLYNQELKSLSLRYTNNDEPKFTDQEIMTLYLFVVQQEQRFSVQQMYDFADQYLRSWFAALPSYQAFNNRLNRLSEGFKAVAAHSFDSCLPAECTMDVSLADSFPIITCSGKRKGKEPLKLPTKDIVLPNPYSIMGLNYMLWPFQHRKKCLSSRKSSLPPHPILS